MRIQDLGNQAMQDQVMGLIAPGLPDEKQVLSGLLSSPIPNQEVWKHDALREKNKIQLDEWNAEIFPALSEAEGGHQKWVKDNGNYQGFNGDGTNWKSGGKGKNVGTNRGVTAMTLAKLLDVSSYDITEDMIANVTAEQASKIFKEDYYDRYGVGEIKKASFRKLAGVMTPLRNSAPGIVKKAEKDGKTLDQTVRLVLEDYKKVGLKNYNEYIKGWVNRARKTAGMEPFRPEETLEDVYKEYPTLRRPAWVPPAIRGDPFNTNKGWYAQ